MNLFILNNLNFLFLLTLIFSSLFSISSMNWMSMWMGLEINMISFIPLMLNKKNILSNEVTLKYFLIQALASSTFLFFCLFSSFNFFFMNDFFLSNNILLILPLILKLGASPFQNWFVMVMEGLNWSKCFILMTWQKLSPLFLIFYLTSNSFFLSIFSFLSLILGAIAGLNQTSLKKILAYSSINHLGWMLSSLLLNKTIFIFYFFIYFILNFLIIINLNFSLNNFNQIIISPISLSFSISLLSLAGLPPFLGFLPKWFIIQNFIHLNFFLSIFFMISSTLLTMIFYIRLIFSNLILINLKQKWNLFFLKKFIFLNAILSMISSFPLFIFNIIF